MHIALGLSLEHWHQIPFRFRSSRRVGCALVLAGTALAAGATQAAGDVDLSHPSRLVTTGPYGVFRHPMYAAWSLAYLGLTLVTATAWPVLLVPSLAVWVVRDVRREERMLTDTFGSDRVMHRPGGVARRGGP